MKPIRVGVVPFLNAMPLWLGLADDPAFELVPDTPANLSDRMLRADLDIGLLPVLEALRAPALSFFGDLGVAAEGIVDSVGLFTRVDLAEIASVALDEASRTSAALTRIILAEAGATPRYVTAAVRAEELGSRDEDAVLLIGDNCLRGRKLESGRVWVDLAAEWKLLADLPFVFAVWAGRPEALTPALHERLREALPIGRARAFEHLEEAGLETGHNIEELGIYISQTIQHRLDERAIAGLTEFARRAHGLGMLPSATFEIQS